MKIFRLNSLLLYFSIAAMGCGSDQPSPTDSHSETTTPLAPLLLRLSSPLENEVVPLADSIAVTVFSTDTLDRAKSRANWLVEKDALENYWQDRDPHEWEAWQGYVLEVERLQGGTGRWRGEVELEQTFFREIATTSDSLMMSEGSKLVLLGFFEEGRLRWLGMGHGQVILGAENWADIQLHFWQGMYNRAPIANAGTDGRGNAGDTIALNGSESFDTDGDALSFHWEEDRRRQHAADLVTPYAGSISL